MASNWIPSDSVDASLDKFMESALDSDNLQSLQKAFFELDIDHSGSITEEELIEAFSIVFDHGPPDAALSKLFMKIDANSDGFIDWEEFSTFLLLGNARKERDVFLEVFQSELIDPNESSGHHKDMIDHILVLENRYVTSSRDGYIKIWKADTLELQSTVKIGMGWVRCTCMLKGSLLACSSIDRGIYLVDLTTNEVTTKIKTGVGMATCMCTFALDSVWAMQERERMSKSSRGRGFRSGVVKGRGEKGGGGEGGDQKGSIDVVAFGDEFGSVTIVSQETRRIIHTDKIHSDGITNISYFPDLMLLVTASLDSTIILYDLDARRCSRKYTGHTKGVNSFVWVQTYLYMASCGLERDILLWSPYSQKTVGKLHGHPASVLNVLWDNRQRHLISISIDKTVCVWDGRTHDIIAKVFEPRQFRPENVMNAMGINPVLNHLITATTRLHVRPICNHSQLQRSSRCHKSPVVAVLCSEVFDQLVTVEEAGWAMVWEMCNGASLLQFPCRDDEIIITAASLDHTDRRLVVGSASGRVVVYNFSNGHRLHELLTDAAMMARATSEITSICPLWRADHERAYIAAAGWDRVVWIWPNSTSSQSPNAISCFSAVGIHDILSMNFVAPNTLATGSFDGKLCLWNIDSGHLRMTLDNSRNRSTFTAAPSSPSPSNSTQPFGTEKSIDSFVFLRKKRPLAVLTGGDCSIRIWDDQAGSLLATKKVWPDSETAIVVLETDETNSFLFTGDADGYVRVLDISQIKPIRGSPMLNTEASESLISRISSARRASEALSSTMLVNHGNIIPLWGWRAHQKGVHSLIHVSCRNILCSSSETNVCCWTMEGVPIATLGFAQWSEESLRAAFNSPQPDGIEVSTSKPSSRSESPSIRSLTPDLPPPISSLNIPHLPPPRTSIAEAFGRPNPPPPITAPAKSAKSRSSSPRTISPKGSAKIVPTLPLFKLDELKRGRFLPETASHGSILTSSILENLIAKKSWWPTPSKKEIKLFTSSRASHYPSKPPYLSGHLPTYNLAQDPQLSRPESSHTSTRAISAAVTARQIRSAPGKMRTRQPNTARSLGDGLPTPVPGQTPGYQTSRNSSSSKTAVVDRVERALANDREGKADLATSLVVPSSAPPPKPAPTTPNYSDMDDVTRSSRLRTIVLAAPTPKTPETSQKSTYPGRSFHPLNSR